MANQTWSVSANFDDTAKLGLINSDVATIDSGATLTINSDTRWAQQACVPEALNISSTTGGEILIDGRDVWEIPFDASTGNVPTLGNLGTNGVTGGTSGATGEYLATFTGLGVNPSTAGGAMPTSGVIKLRTKSGTFQDNEVITLPGGATVTVNSATGGQRSWINVVMEGQASSIITVPRLGAFRVRGDWYYLGETNGADDQTFQFPVQDRCPAFQMETSPGSGVYEWWLNAGDRWGAAVVGISQDIRGKFFGDTTSGVITIARRASNACGFKPASGCKVRIPNVILSASASPYTSLSVNISLGTRPEFVTTASGVIDIEYACSNWYFNFVNTYSLSIQHTAWVDNCIISEPATAISLIDCAASFYSVNGQFLTVTTAFSGGTITDVRGVRRQASSGNSQACNFDDFTGVTMTRMTVEYLSSTATGTTRNNGAARCVNMNRCADVVIEDCVVVGGAFTIQNSSNIEFNDLQYCDLHNSATSGTNATAAINGSGNSGVRINGFSNYDVAGVETHPYTGIVGLSASSDIKVRGIGTSLAPYDGAKSSSANGCAALVLGGNVRQCKVQRCWATRMRTAVVMDNNEDQDWTVSNVYGDYSDSRIVNGTQRLSHGIGEAVNTTQASSSYGTIWVDYFDSATTGSLLIRGNEPTASTSGQCSYTGTTKFDGGGGVVMQTLNDSITFTTPRRVLGHTGFGGTTPAFTGTNTTTNFAYEYQIDTGSGYSAWKTLNTTNLTAETINPTTGFLMKVRSTVSVAAATNLLRTIRIYTTTTASDQGTLYPLNNPNVGYEDTVAGSVVSVWNDSTGAFLSSGAYNAGDAFAQPDWSSDYTAVLRLRAPGYTGIEQTITVTEDGQIIPTTQSDGGVPGTDPGALGITVTNHGASPVTWNSKDWSITITTTNDALTAAQVANFINYNASQIATWNGFSGHAWPRMVEPDGSGFKTVRGRLFGSTGAALKGVRVVRSDSTTAVDGFSSFMADDGTTYSVPVTDDLTVTSSQSGTLLQVFTSGTQTIIASTTGSSLTYTHNGETVDIVAQKAGFLPQRVTGIVLSGDMTQAFTLATDFNYDPAHGLTYTTDASWSRANNQLTVPTWGPSVRNVYSLMVDSFISETSLRNTAFNLSMNGPTTLFLINGAEGATDASITNMTGGGVRYLSGAGATTAEFVGVLSQGVVSGSQAEYELGGGGAIVDARATGDVNEIIKTYGDSSHGNFDKRGHLQFKVQRNGYRQAEADVLDSYGIATLEPTLYIFSLTMPAIGGLTLGDPSATGLTLTDDSASPVSWDAGDGAKDYSITIEDSGTNSGETILRWLNYNLSLDATFQGKEPFYWPEMVLDNGAAYETLRGVLHDNPDVIAGVRVIRTGGTPHPDFTRFQADDGTYGTPPSVATASIGGILTGSKVRIYNETTATESYIGTPGTSYTDTYTDGTTYTAGDVINVRIHKRGYLTYETTVVASASGWTVSASQIEDEIYTALAIDGSAVTGFAADYANDEVNVTVASNFNIADMYAWWSYNLESDDGIRQFVGGITGLDIGNFRINNDIVDIYIDNTTATNIRQLDNRRIFRKDEAYPVKSSGGGGIDVVWKNTILIAAVGSAVLPSDITAIAAAVISEAQTTPIHSDVRKVNSYTVTGAGTTGSPWGPS